MIPIYSFRSDVSGLRELLDASSQRIIRILEALAVREGWTTLSDLSSAVGAGSRTVAEDIAELRRRWGTSLQMEVSRKSGVRLQNRNAATMGMVFTELFNNSVALRWIRELLFFPAQAIEFYERKLFSSRSTLHRTLPKIDRFLSGRGMKIRDVNGKYELVGKDERCLRDFSACFLLELNGLDLRKYHIDINLKFLARLVLSAVSGYLTPRELRFVSSDDVSLSYWTVFYLVSLLREEQGYALVSRYPAEKGIGARGLAYLRGYFPHLGMDNLRAIHQSVFDQYRGWESDGERSLVVREAKALFQRMSSAARVAPDGDAREDLRFILSSLYLNAKARPYKTSVLFDRIAYFALSLKRANPGFYRMAEENLAVFSRNVGFDVSSRLPDFLYWACLSCPEFSRFIRPKKALLADDLGKLHAEFVKKIFSGFFNREYGQAVLIDIAGNPAALTADQIRDYDILLTTVPQLPVSHPYTILINDYPSREDFLAVYQAVFH